MEDKRWKVLNDKKLESKLSVDKIVSAILANRGITKADVDKFLNPSRPQKLTLRELGISKTHIDKAITRIKEAKKKKQQVIVYGDYDADGVCATAVLWETLYDQGLNVLPYIPERFSEGYGINVESISKLKKEYENLGLIITVDNGIVAKKAVVAASEMGIDTIITDHHLPEKTRPKAHAIIHSTLISGSAVSWVLAREISKKDDAAIAERLSLVALGTIADQLPLTGANRPFAVHGISEIRKTKRRGLRELFSEAKIEQEKIGTYEINFVIAPRLNSAGRMTHAIDSLRLLCTKDTKRAKELARNLSETNFKRQKIVEETVELARSKISQKGKPLPIVVSDESFHEGVIGLAASRIVEEFWLPAFVVAIKGDEAKGSVRSISGFNVIEVLQKMKDLFETLGGHPMAAGFSIKTSKLEEFKKKLAKISAPFLTEEILQKILKIDTNLDFSNMSLELAKAIGKLAPFGIGNPTPVFLTKGVLVNDIKAVGRTKDHLKLRLTQNGQEIDAIAFKKGDMIQKISSGDEIDVVSSVEENIWNGRASLQLNVKDIKMADVKKS